MSFRITIKVRSKDVVCLWSDENPTVLAWQTIRLSGRRIAHGSLVNHTGQDNGPFR